jgi:dihydrofolate synthase/folylpolyglutamate synthase
MDVDELAAVAREVIGEQRLWVEPRLPEAIETAVASAEEIDPGQGRSSDTGVVITGSVAMVGEARTLFGREPQ